MTMTPVGGYIELKQSSHVSSGWEIIDIDFIVYYSPRSNRNSRTFCASANGSLIQPNGDLDVFLLVLLQRRHYMHK